MLEQFFRGEPGPGIEAAEYLAARRVVALGVDNIAVDAIPYERPGLTFPVHQTLLARNGIYTMENINTRVLVDAGVSEFLFMLNPLPIAGAAQTFASPVAIR